MAIDKNPGQPLRLLSVFTSSGTWTAPAGVTRAFVSIHGASGGGGNLGRYISSSGSTAGGAGVVSGAWVQVTPSATHAVVVGAGGSAGPNPGGHGVFTGGSGGTSSFEGNTFVVTGGSGGAYSPGNIGTSSGLTTLTALPAANSAIPKVGTITNQATGGQPGGNSTSPTSTSRYGSAGNAGPGAAGIVYIYV